MNVLQEAKQQIDPRLQEMVRYGGGGGGRYGGRGWGRGGHRGMLFPEVENSSRGNVD